MDIYCKHCGEPVAMDELHYVDAAPLLADVASPWITVELDTQGRNHPITHNLSSHIRAAIFNATKTTDGYLPFSVAKDLFYRFGCSVFEGKLVPCSNSPICNDYKLDAIDMLQDLLGDDVDGVAAMMEDFNFDNPE
jgi:hypothetical protein